MSKKVLLALMVGYLLRAFQKSVIWRGAKKGFTKSLLKVVRDDFPDLLDGAMKDMSPEQQEKARKMLEGL